MTQIPNLLKWPIILLAIVAFGGCKKFMDYYKDHHDHDEQGCQISKITLLNVNPNSIFTFEYDQWDNPTQINIDGNEFRYLFHYDNQRRLTEYIIVNAENQYYEWHKYAYQGDLAIRDTVHEAAGVPLSDITDGTTSEYYDALLGVVVSDIKYDDKNRVVADSGRYIRSPSEETHYQLIRTYFYDSTDNLVPIPFPRPPFDNKTAIHRSNKIWMFIERNYSRNNATPATAYNEFGLPTEFTPPLPPGGILSFLGATLSDAKIEYVCK